MATEYYGTPEPALTAYLVFFLNRPDRTSSLVFNVALVVLITFLIAFVFMLAILVVDAPAWRVATMALVSVGFLFLASASKLRPLGAILAMIVAYALDLLGFIPLGELATRALLYAWLFVATGAGVSLVVNLLIAPAPRRLAERAIAERLRAAAALLVEPGAAEVRSPADRRDVGAGEILERLHLARLERTVTAEGAPHLEGAAHRTATILLLAETIRNGARVSMVWRRARAVTLRAMAGAFERGGYPVNILAPIDGLSPARGQRAEALIRDFDGVLAHFADPIAKADAPEAARSDSSSPTPSPIRSICTTRSRRPPRRWPAISFMSCSTGPASIPA